MPYDAEKFYTCYCCGNDGGRFFGQGPTCKCPRMERPCATCHQCPVHCPGHGTPPLATIRLHYLERAEKPQETPTDAEAP